MVAYEVVGRIIKGYSVGMCRNQNFGFHYSSDITIDDMKFDGYNLVLYLFIISIAEAFLRPKPTFGFGGAEISACRTETL